LEVDPTAATIPAFSALASLSPGEMVAERYRVQAVLGRGATGIVYRVEHVFMRKAFALKVLDGAWSRIPGAFERFQLEAIALGKIADPHVAHATDFGRLPNGACFLVLEYVEGRTLRRELESGRLDPRRALTIARGIVSAAHAAHKAGVIHRDLKPENIMLLQHESDPDYVKVLDFGLARFESSAASRDAPKVVTQQGLIVGTPLYMSPEQVTGAHIDPRTDLYAVGVILFEMLTGNCPFRGEPVAVVSQHVLQEAPHLPRWVLHAAGEPVAEILRRLLAKSPDGRFASAQELGIALDQCLQPTAVPPGSQSTDNRQESPAWRARATQWLLGVRAAVLAHLRARRRRNRLRAAWTWPREIVSRLRSWSWRRPRRAAQSIPNALVKRLRESATQIGTRIRFLNVRLALAVTAALLLIGTVWYSRSSGDAPLSSVPARSVRSVAASSIGSTAGARAHTKPPTGHR
jgi:serine/threonine-protein kinase